MRLVADRFVLDDRGGAVDLASAERVTLVVAAAGDVASQARWSERCDTFHLVRHHAVAPLVDFGLVDAHMRFEAWASGPRFRGSRDEARRVHACASTFLRATARSTGDYADAQIAATSRGAGIYVPDAGTGYPTGEVEPGVSDMPLVGHGIRLVDRPSLAALSEMFTQVSESRSRAATVWGPPGAGRHVAVQMLARAARMNGFVPVAADLIASAYAELWRGRSVFVIAAGLRARPWTAFLRASLDCVHAHVLVIAGDREHPAVDGVPLGRVPDDALVAAVCPRIVGTRLEAAARRAVARARGLPGRFASALWHTRRVVERDRTCRGFADGGRSIAAEQPAVYGGGTAPAPGQVAVASWPAPGELASLRRRKESAVALIEAGRHVPGIRELRQTIGSLARRGAWSDSTEGSCQLAAALLGRGRPADAQRALDDAREHAGRCGSEPLLVDMAVLSGEAWIDRARLDEGERILAAAVTAARAIGDPARAAAASLGLGRCLFWRGRYAEAAACLDSCSEAIAGRLQPRLAALASRVAAGRGDGAGALALAATARERASTAGDGQRAAAAYAAAFAHLAMGDLDAAEREVTVVLAAARAARDRLRALRARLLAAEIDRRRTRHAAVAATLGRLRRPAVAAPPLVKVRWQLAVALCEAGPRADAAAIVGRHVAASGLGALDLYVRGGARAGSAHRDDSFLEHIVSVLDVCQTAEDETVVLREVCSRLRQRLHAAAAAIFVIDEGRQRIVAGDGARIDSDVAARAVGASIVIAPHRHDERVEAAAPVLYGGAPIAAICVRWTIGSSYDTASAVSVLRMTAAAAAPVVAAALARLGQATATADDELLGVSRTMTDLRRSVAAAASAPFPVVVDGESGSGKELVARAIHRGSPRRHKVFRALNCAALPDDLVEAELFGHARGAFTGAAADRAGVFEDAHGGTLFLDEIGELSPRAQAKVLRVVQEGELRRVGESCSRRIDVRIVAATNRDLRREVEAGRFRLDLLYRLDVIHIHVPALRDRREDIALLAEHFWRDASARVAGRATLAPGTVAALVRYDWPGNVRELQNVLASLAVRCPKRGIVPPSALPPAFGAPAATGGWKLEEARRTFEERFVRAALTRTGGHRGRAADELGVTRQGLAKLMSRLGISV